MVLPATVPRGFCRCPDRVTPVRTDGMGQELSGNLPERASRTSERKRLTACPALS